MNRFHLLTLLALLTLIIALPIYAMREPARMAAAEEIQRNRYLAMGTDLYIENCAACHGPAGEGAPLMPALNNPALSQADPHALFQVIARAAHGTSMAAWHIEEGGFMNDYEIGSLVGLIQESDWERVAAQAAGIVLKPAFLPDPDAAVRFAAAAGTEDPHDCVACHEEPDIHASRFGLNCANCHTLEAWKPALLTRHTFLIDHGDEGNQACQACHTESYVDYTCYQCHDHEPGQMQEVHVSADIPDYEACTDCHPTGEPGEAGDLVAGE